MSRHPFIALLMIAAALASCDPHRVYEKNTKVPYGIWNRDNPVVFSVDIRDTVSTCNLYINVRNTGMYPMRNLYLFIKTTAPSGNSVVDTVDVLLAGEKGKWYGKGLGDIWDLSTLYKKGIRFAQEGTYTFSFEQAMRMENLPFILDVGLRIETTSNR